MNLGIVLRDATRDDVPAIARLHVLTFDETHGRGPPVALRLQQWESTFATEDGSGFCIVLENEAHELIGFARGKPYHEPEPAGFRGLLNKIYLLRAYHRRGLGRSLICAVASRFLERGITSMLLFGDARSPTNPFYEAMGGEKLFAPNGEFHGGYGWRDLETLHRSCGENRRP